MASASCLVEKDNAAWGLTSRSARRLPPSPPFRIDPHAPLAQVVVRFRTHTRTVSAKYTLTFHNDCVQTSCPSAPFCYSQPRVPAAFSCVTARNPFQQPADGPPVITPTVQKGKQRLSDEQWCRLTELLSIAAGMSQLCQTPKPELPAARLFCLPMETEVQRSTGVRGRKQKAGSGTLPHAGCSF